MAIGIEIKAKKSIVGSKLTIKQSHVSEIEAYIKSLEAQNTQLLKENRDLESKIEEKSLETIQVTEDNEQLKKKVEQQEMELENLTDEFLDQELASEKLELLLEEKNTKIRLMTEYVPTADDYSKSYDLLENFQQKLIFEASNSTQYDISVGDIARIAQYGLEITKEFISKKQVFIPMKNENIVAKLHLWGIYTERREGSLNVYSDYSIAVDVFDKGSGEVKKYDIYDFDEKFKNDIAKATKAHDLNMELDFPSIIENPFSGNEEKIEASTLTTTAEPLTNIQEKIRLAKEKVDSPSINSNQKENLTKDSFENEISH